MVNRNKIVIFDLDDTLYKEIQFLKSAFQHIAFTVDKNNQSLRSQMFQCYKIGGDAFELVNSLYPNVSILDMISLYRNHKPIIDLSPRARDLILMLSQFCTLGIITDGRSKTQRNKLDALEITQYFSLIIISEEIGTEKPALDNYKIFQEKFNGDFFYIGDNLNKDFVTPNSIGWTTICIKDSGSNIHKQNFNLSQEMIPKLTFDNFDQLYHYFQKIKLNESL